MKNRDLVIGFITGVAATFLIKEVYDRKAPYHSADAVLKHVKSAFKEEGPIDGSWIYMKTEPYRQHAITTDVYRGGITRHRQDELEQFEFVADAYTGTILEVTKS